MKVFASFILAFNGYSICSTTRAKDHGEMGQIGLPGGKLDPGESAHAAAKREAKEEGWNIPFVDSNPFYEQIVEGELIQWFYGINASPLEEYKEKGRIKPILSSVGEVRNCGFGNDQALKAFINL